MGSSKKKKEKREKKKHKRDRSRERDTYRTHKKERERRHSRDRDDSDESYSDKKRYESTKHEKEESKNQLKAGHSTEQSKSNSDCEAGSPAPAIGYEDEEFDIDELLDSKLSENPEFSEKKPVSKKLSAEAVIRNVERIASKEQKPKEGNNSHDPFTSRYDYVPGLDLVNEGRLSKESSSIAEMEPQFVSSNSPLVKREPEEGEKSYSRPHDTVDSEALDEGEIEEPGKSHSSLSIEETNKLRAKLGLKPLDVGNQIPGLGDDEGEDKSSETKKKEVFVKTENISELRSAAKLKEKIQVQKEKRKILEKFSDVKPLGASDSEDDDSAAAWVKKSRKLQEEREQAEKRAKLLEELDEEFGVGALVEEEFQSKKSTYTSKDLKGITVAHDSSLIKEGQQIVLTLKDRGVLDEDDDVLQNVNLVDEERYLKNIENKKKKPVYQPYEEEYDEFGILKKKNLLSKYDEEIQGEEKKSFTIGDTASVTSREKELELIRMKLNQQQQKVTLEMPNLKLASEYYTPADMVQFKKPKKKKKLRKLKADDLLLDPSTVVEENYGSRAKKQKIEEPGSLQGDVVESMETNQNEAPKEADVVSDVFDDEDQAEKELYSALNKARRLKERKTTDAPEKVVASVLKTVETEETDDQPAKAGPIILNSVAEFCRTLGDIPTYGMSGNRDEDADELMEFERELMEERQRQELEAQSRGAWNEVNLDEEPTEIMIRENEPILEEEPNISLGVAGALELAQKKGYLDKEAKKLLSGPRASQLQAQSYTIEEKFYEDDKFGKRDRYTGPIQDFREKGSYKPDVKLEYIDDNGRLLNAKEAFRYLSHKFHGKGPGKNKVDKRMKKLEQDTKLKQMSSTDTPLNTVKLLQAKQKEAQSPYIVLSGGSKALTQTMISKSKHP